jgi:hypothetical protein
MATYAEPEPPDGEMPCTRCRVIIAAGEPREWNEEGDGVVHRQPGGCPLEALIVEAARQLRQASRWALTGPAENTDLNFNAHAYALTNLRRAVDLALSLLQEPE